MRALGFVLVFVFSLLCGKYCSDREMRKIVFCREMCDFLQYLCTAVSRGVKLDDIISGYCDKNSTNIIKAKNRSELLKVLENESKYEKMDGFVYELADFMCDIGKSGSIQSETAKSQQMLERTVKICDGIITESMKRKELYRKLGVIFGISICVVLM